MEREPGPREILHHIADMFESFGAQIGRMQPIKGLSEGVAKLREFAEAYDDRRPEYEEPVEELTGAEQRQAAGEHVEGAVEEDLHAASDIPAGSRVAIHGVAEAAGAEPGAERSEETEVEVKPQDGDTSAAEEAHADAGAEHVEGETEHVEQTGEPARDPFEPIQH